MNRISQNAAALALSMGLGFMSPVSADFPNGVASGDTTQTTTVLWARSTSLGELRVKLATEPTFTQLVGSYQVSAVDSQVPVKLKLSALTANTAYYYQFTDAAGVSAMGQFRTAASAGGFHGLHFGVSGDWRGELSPYPVIRNAKDQSLDFFLKLGDTIYADSPSPAVMLAQAQSVAEFRSKHAEVYAARAGLNSWADLQASTSVWALPDDHEVTDDFIGYAEAASDPRFAGAAPGTKINGSALYNHGIQAFLEYNPIQPRVYDNTGLDPRSDGKIKFYRYQTYGDDAALLLLDSRSFRDAGLAGAIKPLSVNTMLGKRQLQDLKTDLLDAEKRGITWKFIALPEPIQNLGSAAAQDRYEGYAGERAELLQFIAGHQINNVVFITADIHGTLINNLAYQAITAKGLSQFPTTAWEISTGAVAYFEPLGPTWLAQANSYNIPGILSPTAFAKLTQAQQEAYVLTLLNLQLRLSGYDSIGLEGAPVAASLLSGSYAATTTYGWTEFQIEANSQTLRVTVWGVDAYSIPTTSAELSHISALNPRIVSQFEVKAKRAIINTALPAVLTSKISASRKVAKIKQKISYAAQISNSSKSVAKNVILNFTLRAGTADVVSMGKTCHRFANTISCRLGNVKKRATHTVTFSPKSVGILTVGIDVMTATSNDVSLGQTSVTTTVAAR